LFFLKKTTKTFPRKDIFFQKIQISSPFFPLGPILAPKSTHKNEFEATFWEVGFCSWEVRDVKFCALNPPMAQVTKGQIPVAPKFFLFNTTFANTD